jgi:hypothetical protein
MIQRVLEDSGCVIECRRVAPDPQAAPSILNTGLPIGYLSACVSGRRRDNLNRPYHGRKRETAHGG